MAEEKSLFDEEIDIDAMVVSSDRVLKMSAPLPSKRAAAAAAAVDLDLWFKDTRYYLATLSPKDWFDRDQLKPIFAWFSKHDQVYGVTEIASHKHLHVLFSSKQKKTGNVTRALNNLLDQNNIPNEKGVTVDVRYSSVPLGHLHYLTNEVKGGTQVMIKGWRLTWLQQQCRDNLKSMPKVLLKKGVYVVSNVEGPELIVKYAAMHNRCVNDKASIIRCIASMCVDKYRFHNTKIEWLCADTMALCGNMRGITSLLEGKLQFIDA